MNMSVPPTNLPIDATTDLVLTENLLQIFQYCRFWCKLLLLLAIWSFSNCWMFGASLRRILKSEVYHCTVISLRVFLCFCSLTIKYKLYCHANYYSSNCSVYCVASNTDTGGHYTCDPATGNIVCRPGTLLAGLGVTYELLLHANNDVEDEQYWMLWCLLVVTSCRMGRRIYKV